VNGGADTTKRTGLCSRCQGCLYEHPCFVHKASVQDNGDTIWKHFTKDRSLGLTRASIAEQAKDSFMVLWVAERTHNNWSDLWEKYTEWAGAGIGKEWLSSAISILSSTASTRWLGGYDTMLVAVMEIEYEDIQDVSVSERSEWGGGYSTRIYARQSPAPPGRTTAF
jgi:hypothetical protein